MGLCYSLRPRLFGDPGASSAEPEQSPELAAPMRAGDPRQGELHRPGTQQQPRRGELAKPARGDSPDGLLLLLQNGDGRQQHKPGKGAPPQPPPPQQHQQLPKGWDKLRLEEKEAEREAKKVSKSIDRVLKEQKREYKQTHRLLLLGNPCATKEFMEGLLVNKPSRPRKLECVYLQR